MSTEDKLLAFLLASCLALFVALGVATHLLHEARAVIDRQEAQLKELYGQVNDITMQYVGIVRRLNEHGK